MYSKEESILNAIFREIKLEKFSDIPMVNVKINNNVKTDGDILFAEGCYYIILRLDNIENVINSLLHNMIHLENHINGIKDTSNRGAYHNKRFFLKANECGAITKRGKYGYEIIGVNDELTFIVNHYRKIFPNRKESTCRDVSSKKSSTRKYICPCCGNSFRATKNINVFCGECGVKFELA